MANSSPILFLQASMPNTSIVNNYTQTHPNAEVQRPPGQHGTTVVITPRHSPQSRMQHNDTGGRRQVEPSALRSRQLRIFCVYVKLLL